jgi:RNAse (barnase) inhibitor barstar
MTGRLGALTAGQVPPGRYRLDRPLTVRAIRDELMVAGWGMRIVDGAAMVDRAALFDVFAVACDFPDWFGRNWDAFADCLRDLSWLPPAPLAVLWQRSGAVDPRLAHDAGRVIDAAIEARIAAGLPALAVLYPPADASDGGVPLLRPAR